MNNTEKINVWSWIIIDDFWRILLIKRKFNKKYLPKYWALPGWKQEPWESLKETAIREIKEEVWLDFKITKLFLEEQTYEWEFPDPHYFHRYLWKYSWEIKIQEKECDGYWWFNYDETKELFIYKSMMDIIDKLFKENLIK